MIYNVTEHGWPAVKLKVAGRDRACLATRSEVFGKGIAPDLCRNSMRWVIRDDHWRDMELEHVKEELGLAIRAANDEAHLVLVCAWHHRLSNEWRIDSAEHRELVRGYLARHYPEVWADWLATRTGSFQPPPEQP